MILTYSLLIIQMICALYIIVRAATLSSYYYKLYDKKYVAFTDKLLKEYESFSNMVTERMNLLSKENARLMEENEKLRGKLKNLGFTDITLDK